MLSKYFALGALGLMLVPQASGQQSCEGWLPTNTQQGASGSGRAVAVWDADGPGPIPARLVVGGEFDEIGRLPCRYVAVRIGETWEPIADGFNGTVRALAVLPGLSGNEPPRLIASGSFNASGSIPMVGVGQLTSTGWMPLGTGLFTGSVVNALAGFDPDGSGPAVTSLVVGGNLSLSQGATARNLAMWDGQAWSIVGPGAPAPVDAITVFDPDGGGPLGPRIIASTNATEGGRVYMFEGANRTSLSGNFSGFVQSLGTYDFDGDGPEPPQLLAGGTFSHVSSVPISRVARWNGSAWEAVGSGLTTTTSQFGVKLITRMDPDGPGPLGEHLVIAGDFQIDDTHCGFAYWDGTGWRRFADGFKRVMDAEIFDFDAEGDLPAELVSANFGTSWAVDRWNWTIWRGFGGLVGHVRAIELFDFDGGGPLPEELVIAGTLNTWREQRLDTYVAVQRNGEWIPMSTGLSTPPRDLRRFDPDGPGPEPAQLLACGADLRGDDLPVARWNGTSWETFGHSIPNYGGMSLSVLDFGNGQSPQLYMSMLYGFGSSYSGMVMKWSGTSWVQQGNNLPGRPSPVIMADLDGPGPRSARPYVCINNLSQSDPQAVYEFIGSWQRLGSAFNWEVWTLAFFDLDGDGPDRPVLVAGGTFTSAGGVPLSRIAYWNYDQWRWDPLGGGMDSIGLTTSVLALQVHDRDGPGPLSPDLIAIGGFDTAGGTPANNIARWSGGAWQPMGAGIEGGMEMLSLPRDGGAELLVGGSFFASEGQPSAFLASWGPANMPRIDGMAGGGTIGLGGVASFQIAAAGAELAYQWFRNGVALTDGATPWGSSFSGATSSSLTLHHASSGDSGSYTCVVTNGCGEVASPVCALVVQFACGTADFDSDGDSGTDADIEAFFACLAGACCPTCWHLGSDFDADGDSGTDADIESFFRVLAGGPC